MVAISSANERQIGSGGNYIDMLPDKTGLVFLTKDKPYSYRVSGTIK